MHLSEKLSELRKQSKLTQKAIAELLGVSQVAYSNWEKGNKSPTPANIEKLANIFQVSSLYLKDENDAGQLINIYTKLQPLRQEKLVNYAEDQLEEQEKESLFLVEKPRTLYEVRVYERVSAGLGAGLLADGTYDTVLTDKPLPRYDIATWVSGDSMNQDFPGNSVLLLADTKFDYDGAIYAVYVEEENATYVKRVYRERNGLRLVSSNPNYTDIFVPYDLNPRIVGKFVGNFVPVEL